MCENCVFPIYIYLAICKFWFIQDTIGVVAVKSASSSRISGMLSWAHEKGSRFKSLIDTDHLESGGIWNLNKLSLAFLNNEPCI